MKHRQSRGKRFAVSLEVPEAQLGALLAMLDNKFPVGLRLIKDLEPGRNVAAGSMKQMMAELIGKAKGGQQSLQTLREQLAEQGFTKASVYTQTRRYAKEGYFVIAKGLIRLGKKPIDGNGEAKGGDK